MTSTMINISASTADQNSNEKKINKLSNSEGKDNIEIASPRSLSESVVKSPHKSGKTDESV